jgi:glycosyltransferase involved in cell wall biosynthesis
MKVSVVLASKNELTMLLMTVLSAREALNFAGVEGEIIVVDNSDPEFKPAVKSILAGVISDKTIRLFHEEVESAAKIIDRCHREASGEFLFFTDAHTLVGHDTIKHLLDFYEKNDTGKMAFLYAPIQWAHQAKQYRYTHFSIKGNKLGSWCKSSSLKEPAKVPWKGMPYLIRRSTYLAIDGYGCCAEYNLGWGALYYLGPKPWLLGYENWAIPEGVVYHFGGWPDEVEKHVKYRTYGNKNPTPYGSPIAVACYVFGGEELLKNEYENLPLLKRLFKTYEDALTVAKKFGEVERQQMQGRMKISYNDLLDNPPWGKDLQ